MVADVLLALALVYTFMCCMAWMIGPMSWYETDYVVLGAWGALGGLVCGCVPVLLSPLLQVRTAG